MSDERKINPKHKEIRRVFRIVGPITAGLGLLLTAIGIGSFFSAFGSFEAPRYFWCAFIGGPLLVVGLAITMFGFMGAVTRYQAGEVAPVGKDTFNYMAEGTKAGVKTMASAVGAGLAEGMGSDAAASVTCASCGHANDQDAKFCDECGAALSKLCPACKQANDQDAKFCDNCGGKL